MRPKIILMILLPALVIAGMIIFLKPHSAIPVPIVAPAPAVNVLPTPAPAPQSAPTPAPAVVPTLTPEEHQAAIDTETDRLSDWAMNDDPQSLSNILNDLTSPEKEVRLAAVEAAKQFESPDAIPALKAAAASTDDNQEAIEMLEAADWLALPNADFHPSGSKPQLTSQQMQNIEQDRIQAQARREAYMQKHHPQTASGSDSQPAPSQNSTTGSNQ